MNRFAYRVLVGLFGASVLAGAALLAPRPAELGFVEHEMTCDAWFAREGEAVTGLVRLTDCRLDVSRMVSRRSRIDRGVTEAAVQVRPPTAEPARGSGPHPRELVLVTADPALRRLADTYDRHGDAAGTARFGERHRAEGRRPRTIEGRIELGGHWDLTGPLLGLEEPRRPHVMAPPRRDPASRAAGTLLLLLGGSALLILVPAQRRWTRRRAELRGDTTRPLRF